MNFLFLLAPVISILYTSTQSTELFWYSVVIVGSLWLWSALMKSEHSKDSGAMVGVFTLTLFMALCSLDVDDKCSILWISLANFLSALIFSAFGDNSKAIPFERRTVGTPVKHTGTEVWEVKKVRRLRKGR